MIAAHVAERIGAAIRLMFIGLGAGAFSHMLTQEDDGIRYWIGAGAGLGLYFIGAMLEFFGEYKRKKNERSRH